MNNNQFNKSMQTIKNYVDENIPTKTSQLTNDSDFITEHQDISDKADKSYVNTELAKKSDKTHTHSYNDLSDKPAIPSINGLATETFVTNKIADSLILTSPNGSKFTITVSDDGQLSATPYGTNE